MSSTKKQARIAGFLYLLLGITAPIGLLYVPGKLIVPGDATATADRIRASEWLLRVGIGSELVHQTIAIFLVLALYRLFRPVNEHLAWHVVILGALVSVPIMFLNVLNEIAALVLVSGADFLSVFERNQLDALAYLFLRLHSHGIDVASIFWGLWLFPFGILVIRSSFIPRALGVLMVIAGFAYLINAFTTILLPAVRAARWPGRDGVLLCGIAHHVLAFDLGGQTKPSRSAPRLPEPQDAERGTVGREPGEVRTGRRPATAFEVAAPARAHLGAAGDGHDAHELPLHVVDPPALPRERPRP